MWASPGLLGPISPPQRPAQRGSETLCRQGADSRCPWFHLPRGRSSTFSLGGSFQQVPFSRLKSRFHITTEIPGPVLGTLQALLQSGVQPQPWGPQHRHSPGPRGQASGEVSGPAGEGGLLVVSVRLTTEQGPPPSVGIASTLGTSGVPPSCLALNLGFTSKPRSSSCFWASFELEHQKFLGQPGMPLLGFSRAHAAWERRLLAQLHPTVLGREPKAQQ